MKFIFHISKLKQLKRIKRKKIKFQSISVWATLQTNCFLE